MNNGASIRSVVGAVTVSTRDRTPRHFDVRDVAVVIDPDGGEHPVRQLLEEYAPGVPKFWCAGRVALSPGELAERIWAHWYDETPYDSTYERQERAFTERFEQ